MHFIAFTPSLCNLLMNFVEIIAVLFFLWPKTEISSWKNSVSMSVSSMLKVLCRRALEAFIGLPDKCELNINSLQI